MSQLTLDCGHTINTDEHKVTTGYGIEPKTNRKICYQCCADNDREYMLNNDKICLYLVRNGKWNYSIENVKFNSTWNITNWPNSLSFPVIWYTKGKHNIAKVRYDAWFVGPNNHIWWCVQYGEDTQIVHCKKTKQKVNR